jgi:hypothetical protein
MFEISRDNIPRRSAVRRKEHFYSVKPVVLEGSQARRQCIRHRSCDSLRDRNSRDVSGKYPLDTLRHILLLRNNRETRMIAGKKNTNLLSKLKIRHIIVRVLLHKSTNSTHKDFSYGSSKEEGQHRSGHREAN